MRVAIVGTGSFAKHFIDELPAAGHEIVVLTRSHKDFLDGKKGVVEQRVTDYSSVAQLAEVFNDCDALVSTVFDMKNPSADTHLKLLEACKQTPKCKRFIPAEYGGNAEDFSEDEENMDSHNAPLKKALRDVRLARVYIVPSASRNHRTSVLSTRSI